MINKGFSSIWYCNFSGQWPTLKDHFYIIHKSRIIQNPPVEALRPVATMFNNFQFSEELVFAAYTVKNSKSLKQGFHNTNSSPSTTFWTTVANIN
jgi:hypothetical protein